jgi:hypothetical protein
MESGLVRPLDPRVQRPWVVVTNHQGELLGQTHSVQDSGIAWAEIRQVLLVFHRSIAESVTDGSGRSGRSSSPRC